MFIGHDEQHHSLPLQPVVKAGNLQSFRRPGDPVGRGVIVDDFAEYAIAVVGQIHCYLCVVRLRPGRGVAPLCLKSGALR